MISIKSKSEIERMKKAGEIIIDIFERLRNIIVPGISTKELDAEVEAIIRKSGAIPSFKGYKGFPGAIDFPACICTSINNEVVHGIPGERRLEEGDILSVDVGVCLDGYHSDAESTFQVGKISKEAERLITVTEESFFEGIKKAVAGNRIFDISSAIEEHVKTNGFSVVRDYVGHGIGREMHELPQIPNYRTRERGARLEAGMTLAIEPMVNQGRYHVKLLDNKWTVVTADGSLSAHYENTIVVTEDMPLILTKQ